MPARVPPDLSAIRCIEAERAVWVPLIKERGITLD